MIAGRADGETDAGRCRGRELSNKIRRRGVMGETSRPYCETTDLYLQLLSDAQRMEDQRMVRMVLRKLKGCGYGQGPDNPQNRDVIPFPALQGLRPEGGSSDLFWQDILFWQNLVQFLILLVTGATWLTLPFILAAILVKG
jgi:hypothetical protein